MRPAKAMTHRTPAPLPTDGVEPVAWLIYDKDGDDWWATSAKSTADGYVWYGVPVRPLFAHPPKPLIDAGTVEALQRAAQRVANKYGRHEDGSIIDWTEWQDLREALAALAASQSEGGE